MLHACAARFVTVVLREKFLDLNKTQVSFLYYPSLLLADKVRLAALKDSMKNCINQTFLLIRALVT
jgi:hypothetical protein